MVRIRNPENLELSDERKSLITSARLSPYEVSDPARQRNRPGATIDAIQSSVYDGAGIP